MNKNLGILGIMMLLAIGTVAATGYAEKVRKQNGETFYNYMLERGKNGKN